MTPVLLFVAALGWGLLLLVCGLWEWSMRQVNARERSLEAALECARTTGDLWQTRWRQADAVVQFLVRAVAARAADPDAASDDETAESAPKVRLH